ncbi:MAG: thiamine pyrophosphate-dependent dehydrogenase E1 component subunit alpha [Chloroflexi bacterium]|nr:thiamine pyrophosphate-dependent dehydrogenase E1 component subunit alpha [Chloroflexota bacterium]
MLDADSTVVALRRKFAGSGLDGEALRTLYGQMVLSRAVEERLWLLSRQGKTYFVVTPAGHEAAQVASIAAIRPGVDTVYSYYRSLTAVLALGVKPVDVFLHAFGRAADPNSGGRQMPGHYSSSRLKLVARGSVVGVQFPQAAGAALASKIRGDGAVAICYFGDGATSEGDFHGGLNVAAVMDLPVVFFCENNGYAISMPVHRQMRVARVAERAAAYGMPGITVDGCDVVAVYQATRDAVERARRGEGPTLIEALVERLRPHSSDDDDRRYRSSEELAAMRRRDPITRLAKELTAAGLLDLAADEVIHARVQAIVDAATEEAEASPLPDPATATRHIYAD